MGNGQIGTDRGADRLCAGSTGDQKLALQHDALNAAGGERIFEHASGAKTELSGLAEALPICALATRWRCGIPIGSAAE